MPKIRYNGRVSETGRLSIWGKGQFLQDIQKLAGKDVTITVTKAIKPISNKQRGYWHGVVVKMIHHRFKELGNHYTLKQVSAFLMDKFFYTEDVNPATGEIIRIPATLDSIGGASSAMFSEKKEEIQRWASENLDLYIPDPGEQTKIEI